MQNKVELIKNDIIYVQKIGDQTEQSLFELIGKLNQLGAELRKQEKRVLILSDCRLEGHMDTKAMKMSAKIGTSIDYDKSASFGSSPYLNSVREEMIRATHLDGRVANFKTREEALDWLAG